MARFSLKRSTYKKAKRPAAKAKRSRGIKRVLQVLLIVVGVALLVLPVLLLSDPVSYVPLIMAILTIALSWGYVRVLEHSIRVTLDTGSFTCERGREAGFAITLSNRSVLPAPRIELGFYTTNLFGDVDDERTLVCALGPHQQMRAVFDATFVHLGKYEAGVREIRIYDLLGLFCRKQAKGSHNEVLVHPAKVELAGVGVSEVVPDESNHMLKPIASDNEDYSSVREYHRGDPLKTVHWNLSSRNPQGKLYTRLYEEYVNPTLVIVLDCFSPDYDPDTQMSLFDGIVESAASLCAEAQVAGIEAELRYIDARNEKAAAHLSNEDDVISLVNDMRRIQPASKAGGDVSDVEDMLRASGLQSNGFGNVAFITSRADDGCLEALRATRGRRRNVMAFVALPRDLQERDRERFLAPFAGLQSMGAYCYSVESTPMGTKVEAL